MTIEKLKGFEPLFDSWYVDCKIAEGKNSKVFRVSRIFNGVTEYMCIKTVRFPSDDNELSNIIDSGKYTNVDEYLNILENTIRANMDKMLTLRTSDNVVHFEDYAVIKENSCFYVLMLMEILTPLSHVIKADSIEPRNVIKIGTDLCMALSAFREKGIVHRNIKPENIYADSEGNYKLGDFGIYEIDSDDGVQINSYTSPELYRNMPSINSDIYSLGIVLYKLLNNNRAPFLPDYPAPVSLNDRDNAFLRLMRGEMLPSPANTDYALSKIIFKACAFNSAERYMHPMDLFEDFCQYLENLQNNPIITATQQRLNNQQAKAYRIEADNDYYFRNTGNAATNKGSASERDRDSFRQAFDDEDEIEKDNSNKKWYYILLGLVVIGALIVAIILSYGKDDSKDSTTTDISTEAVTTVPVLTTAAETTQEETTEETTAEETTTEESTTEETTAEETTTEETTTEESTTEETTAEETTTEVTTTEQTTAQETTTAATTKPVVTTEPILVFAQNEAGTASEDGKIYVDIINYSVSASLDKGVIVIKIKDDLGSEPYVTGDVSVKMMSGEVLISPCAADLTCKDNKDGTYTCVVKIIDNEYYYEKDIYQYYLVFEEGALTSNNSISLPLQVRVG